MNYDCCTIEDHDKISRVSDEFQRITKLNHFYYLFYVREIFQHHEEYNYFVDLILEGSQSSICKRAAESIKETLIDEDLMKKIDNMIKEV